MPEPLLYLQAMGATAIVSAMIVLAMVGPRRPASTTRQNLACILGMGLGLAFGYYVLGLRWTWPPVNALNRLLTIVVPTTLGIELIAGFSCVPRSVAWCLRIGLAVTIPRILLHGSVYLSEAGNHWTRWEAGTLMAVSGLVLAGCWGLLLWLSQRSARISIPLALALTTQCAGLTVMMAGYLKGGASAFPFVATIMATTIVATIVTKRRGDSANFGAPAMIGIGLVGLFGLLFIGRFFGRLSTGYALTMLLAPLLCWLTEVPFLRARKPWIVGSLRLVLVAIPLVVVLVMAKRDFDRSMAALIGTRGGIYFSSPRAFALMESFHD